MDRNLGMEAVRVTEAAALHAARLVGRGDEENANRAAIQGILKALTGLNLDGRIVIGDDEGDDGLASGTVFGNADAPGAVDIALKAVEGTTPCATGGHNAISVLVLAQKGGLLAVPKVYMEKIAVGPEAAGSVSLNLSVEENLKRVAEAKSKHIEDLTIVILDRPRNERYINAVRKLGARIHLIGDGDVSGAIASAFDWTGIDMLMGIGGAPEGVIAAVGLKCLGGDFQGRFIVRGGDDAVKLKEAGFEEPDRIYELEQIAGGQVMLAATGITDGQLLRGVRFESGGARSHSLAVRSKSGTVRFIDTQHRFEHDPIY